MMIHLVLLGDHGLPHVMQAKTLLMMDDKFKSNIYFSFTMGLLMLFQDCGTISEFWTVIKVWTRQVSNCIFVMCFICTI